MTGRILIVDDEQGLTDVLSELLDLAGYETVVCHDADSARRALAHGSFDVAMLDVFLSNEPVGLDLASEIHAAHPRTVRGVILVTGYADQADICAACLAGAYTCISKPFTLEHVLKAIDAVIGDRHPTPTAVCGGVR